MGRVNCTFPFPFTSGATGCHNTMMSRLGDKNNLPEPEGCHPTTDGQLLACIYTYQYQFLVFAVLVSATCLLSISEIAPMNLDPTTPTRVSTATDAFQTIQVHMDPAAHQRRHLARFENCQQCRLAKVDRVAGTLLAMFIVWEAEGS